MSDLFFFGFYLVLPVAVNLAIAAVHGLWGASRRRMCVAAAVYLLLNGVVQYWVTVRYAFPGDLDRRPQDALLEQGWWFPIVFVACFRVVDLSLGFGAAFVRLWKQAGRDGPRRPGPRLG